MPMFSGMSYKPLDAVKELGLGPNMQIFISTHPRSCTRTARSISRPANATAHKFTRFLSSTAAPTFIYCPPSVFPGSHLETYTQNKSRRAKDPDRRLLPNTPPSILTTALAIFEFVNIDKTYVDDSDPGNLDIGSSFLKGKSDAQVCERVGNMYLDVQTRRRQGSCSWYAVAAHSPRLVFRNSDPETQGTGDVTLSSGNARLHRRCGANADF